jgi:hypothetical protein
MNTHGIQVDATTGFSTRWLVGWLVVCFALVGDGGSGRGGEKVAVSSSISFIHLIIYCTVVVVNYPLLQPNVSRQSTLPNPPDFPATQLHLPFCPVFFFSLQALQIVSASLACRAGLQDHNVSTSFTKSIRISRDFPKLTAQVVHPVHPLPPH